MPEEEVTEIKKHKKNSAYHCGLRMEKANEKGLRQFLREELALAESSEETALVLQPQELNFPIILNELGSGLPAGPSDKSPVWPFLIVALREPKQRAKPSPHGLLTYRNCNMIKFGLFQAAEFAVICYTETEN